MGGTQYHLIGSVDTRNKRIKWHSNDFSPIFCTGLYYEDMRSWNSKLEMKYTSDQPIKHMQDHEQTKFLWMTMGCTSNKEIDQLRHSIIRKMTIRTQQTNKHHSVTKKGYTQRISASTQSPGKLDKADRLMQSVWKGSTIKRKNFMLIIRTISTSRQKPKKMPLRQRLPFTLTAESCPMEHVPLKCNIHKNTVIEYGHDIFMQMEENASIIFF